MFLLMVIQVIGMVAQVAVERVLPILLVEQELQVKEIMVVLVIILHQITVAVAVAVQAQ